MQATSTTGIRDGAANEQGAGAGGATDREQAPAAGSAARTVERKTLSVRRVVRVGEADGGAGLAAARAPAKATASGGATGAIPLKRLTAGRKEISILHDGSTYLLRITKSNKLILTKA